MEYTQNLEEAKRNEVNDNINDFPQSNPQNHDNTKVINYQPNQTLYVNNLNEKIKTDGNKIFNLFLFQIFFRF